MPRPLRRAVSVLVLRPGREPPGDQILCVLRPPDDEELPDVWGLPAASLREDEGWEGAARRAGREKLGVDLRLRGVLREGKAEREAYTLRMRLYEAEVARGEPSVPQPVPGVTQYVAWAWAPPARLQEAARQGSLCSRLCLAWLAAPHGPAGRRP